MHPSAAIPRNDRMCQMGLRPKLLVPYPAVGVF